jgi:2-oxo-3-hexenedioate decarboxylase
LLGTGRQIAPFTDRLPEFSLGDAYRVTSAVRAMRERRGERVIGRKIGFTNRTIWDEYDVHAPMWGFMYDSTVSDAAGAAPVSLSPFAEPRIEPEIIFGLKSAPTPEMDVRALLSCIAWVAHGFEIVQSIYPAWKFQAADTVAAYGLHGGLWIGGRFPIAPDVPRWERELKSFTIELSRNGEFVDRGAAANVLDGPLFALRHLIATLADDPHNPPLAAGEIVTTGTLTRAFPVQPGDEWSTALSGVALPGVKLQFAA